jgi:hypothetical protein
MEDESKFVDVGRWIRLGVGFAKEVGGEVVEVDDPVGSGDRGTVMGVGRVCRLRNGGVACCVDEDDLGSGRSFVGVARGRCSEDLKR